TALRRLYEAYDRMRQAAATAALDPGVVAAARARFTAAMDDDVNTASAVSVLFDLARDADQLVAAGAGAPAAAFIHESMSVLGISPAERATPTAPPAASDAGWSQNGDLAGRVARLRTELADVLHLNGSDDAAVEAIVARRREAKRARDFALADRLRDALAAVGIVLTDDRDGTTQWTAR
ncbi:MAG: DALR domain-containing protein, partial [Candidatus Dormibacteria bacterium]